jgi:hypothetical protein
MCDQFKTQFEGSGNILCGSLIQDQRPAGDPTTGHGESRLRSDVPGDLKTSLADREPPLYPVNTIFKPCLVDENA